MENGQVFILDKNRLEHLLQLLRDDGFRVIGPTIRDGAVIYAEITSVAQLPRGWTHDSDAGVYRLKQREDGHYFGCVVGPQSLKQYLFPPRHKLFSIACPGDGNSTFEVRDGGQTVPQYAFLGVRACDLAALDVQDRVFAGGLSDPYYTAVRNRALIVAVNCTEPAGTCFCASMGTGPRCRSGFDLALTELAESFAIEAGSERGRDLMERLKVVEADANTRRLVDLMLASAAEHMSRSLNTEDLPRILLEHPEHPHWSTVAERCLACANCTLVCPTCFCSNVEDTSDLAGRMAERWRAWGSCFTLEFSYHTGGFVRSSIRARYRHWLTHKLAGWHEQFGTSGCVGCGRCIAWCPVGIDITEEAAAIADDVRRSDKFSRDSKRSANAREPKGPRLEVAP